MRMPGDTVAVVATFTPTTPTSVLFTPVSTGTVLNYSQWLSIIGSSAASDATAGAAGNLAQSSGAGAGVAVGAAWVVGVVGGAWLVAL